MKAFTRCLILKTWMAACSREHARFSAALKRVEETQRRYLLNLLRRNAGTRFGQNHGFSMIASIAEYQRCVPLNPYETLKPYIDAIANGEANILTTDPVRMFQPTSGSASGSKLIPWTRAASLEFQRGINPWLAGLYGRKPALLRGTAYWSISPPVGLNHTRDADPLRRHGKLRVGFDHDSEYLGFFGQQLFSLISAVPPEVALCRDLADFRTRTLLSLLADEELCLISVWSPTFLTVLLADFIARRDEIMELFRRRMPHSMRRYEFLHDLAKEGAGTFPFDRAWPKLQIISCWTHGSSEIYARNLRRLFPQVEIQGKGLVATEAFVSLPFQEHVDPVLAATSHFFEFLDPDTGKISLAHELAAESEYEVVVTTGGGLYRYPLGDRVRVTGFVLGAPCLRFLGRAGLVVDLFGEKLDAAFVDRVVQRVLAEQTIDARFLLLAPVADSRLGTSYTLFIEAGLVPDPAGLGKALEQELAANFHYAHCRALGQLSPARVFRIRHSSNSAESVFLQEMHSRGIKAGDVKACPLDGRHGWERRFAGSFE